MTDRLDEYRRKRDARRTPEPVPPTAPAKTDTRRFVIQQHHARSLHWDVRLERDGVLVSFAVPRGLPRDQARNHLAKHTEDHPPVGLLPTFF
jgi:bifunctional non-homologous end joining protein LigD